MPAIVETGTDGATVCVFDPAALPADFDTRCRDDPPGLFDELAAQGRFWWKETGSDGGFLFHFYVDEEIPARIRPHLEMPQQMARFQAPGGRIYACGAEYAARNPQQGAAGTPKGGLDKFPRMGGSFTLPPGDYALKAWRTEWPEEAMESQLDKELGPGASRRINRTGCAFILLLLVGLGATLGASFFTLANAETTAAANGKLLAWWCTAAGAWLATVFLFRRLKRLENNPIRRKIELDYPSIVIELHRLPVS